VHERDDCFTPSTDHPPLQLFTPKLPLIPPNYHSNISILTSTGKKLYNLTSPTIPLFTMTPWNVTIDDTDNTTIRYQGKWVGANLGFFTFTYSTRTGDNFSVVTPPILAFYYFAFYSSRLNQICIDCDPNNRAWGIIDLSSPAHHGDSGLIYSKQWEDAVVHEIIIANRADPRLGGNSTTITLDKLVYTVDND